MQAERHTGKHTGIKKPLKYGGLIYEFV